MSAREWQPGDVALVRNEYGVWNLAVCSVKPIGLVWQYGVADSQMPINADARPLVVIDPEDREQTARLADLFCEARWCHVKGGDTDDCDPLTRSSMREALAAYIAPTKPAEPTGLGAVVEDRAGSGYVRVSERKRPWLRVGTDNHVHWSEIDDTPIVVLSEGATR